MCERVCVCVCVCASLLRRALNGRYNRGQGLRRWLAADAGKSQGQNGGHGGGQADGNTDHRVAAIGVADVPQDKATDQETEPGQRAEPGNQVEKHGRMGGRADRRWAGQRTEEGKHDGNNGGQADGNTDHGVATAGVTVGPQDKTGTDETDPGQGGEKGEEPRDGHSDTRQQQTRNKRRRIPGTRDFQGASILLVPDEEKFIV
jgi:hypothetical protein